MKLTELSWLGIAGALLAIAGEIGPGFTAFGLAAGEWQVVSTAGAVLIALVGSGVKEMRDAKKVQ